MTTDNLALTRAATFRPQSLDRDAGTVEAVLSTGADVQRAGFVERLSTSRDAVEIGDRIPVLDAHRQGSIGDIKGRVLDVRFEGGAIVATLAITDPAALAMIERGDLTGVSIGYQVSQWRDSKDPATGKRVREAVRWTLREASLVPLPADPQAIIRSENPMPQTAGSPPLETRADINAQIRTLGQSAGVRSETIDSLVDREATLDEARAAILDEVVTRAPAALSAARVGFSPEDPAVQLQVRAEALACRMSGGAPSDAAREFMHFGLADFAREALARAGEAGLQSMSREALLSRAMHTTSDFPSLLTEGGNRVLGAAYQRNESPVKRLARQRLAADFRPLSILKIGDFGLLEKVTESGEITHTTTAESKEGYSLDTFARLFALSRRAIINDDLGAFARWAEMMGQAAAETEARLLVDLLLSNPTMGDDVALFHASHGNLAGAGGTVSESTLDAARLAMRLQKGLDGETPISVTPKFLLVAPDLETTAEKALTQIQPISTADANPFGGRLEILVDPRLPENAWYIFADPAIAPVLEYAYLSSAQGPQLASRDGWEVLGREFRVILDFGCGAVDWRGAYRNPGA